MEILEYNIGTKARAFSTKRGEGSGNYGGFNITHYCGDSAGHIAECRRELCSLLGIEDSRLILPRQTHSCNIHCIDKDFFAFTPEEQTLALEEVDAVITNITNCCIGVSTADCIPVLLYDPCHKVIAAIHAGWRGTVDQITKRCIAMMTETYGCAPNEIQAVIAPGISLEAFEVGDEVYEAFAEKDFPMQDIAARNPTADGGCQWHINLWVANRLQLLECGLRKENIQVAGVCTYSNHGEFFSARRLGIRSGRIFNGIMLL